MPSPSSPQPGPTGPRRLTRVTRFYRDHATLVFRAAPVESTIALTLSALSALAGTAAILLLGQVVGAGIAAIDAGPGTPEAQRAQTWVLWLGVSFLLPPILDGVITVLSEQIMSKSVAHASALTAELGATPVGIAHLEDVDRSAELQTLTKAIHEWAFLEGISATWGVIVSRLAGVGAFFVMASWHWWAAVVLAFGYILSGRALTAWLVSIFSEMMLEPPLERRRSTYLFGLLMEGRAAKEIRLFGLSGWMIDRYRQLWLAAMTGIWKRRNATLGPMFATTVVLAICAAIVFGQMGREAWSGSLSVTTLTALVGASVGMWGLGMLGDNQALFTQSMATTSRLRGAREEVGLPGLAHPADAPSIPITAGPPRAATVRIHDLHFTYPSRTEPIFAGLDRDVPAGQSIAVVGVNGAGKSTLIKLLCGLYAPDAGKVLIDDVAPAQSRSARERVAVIFQDFVRYHLSLKDNVALGARGAPDADAVVERALSDAGAHDFVQRLDGGVDTVLSAEYENGTDLSGGQWQRVALARALAGVAGGSGVLVLDEPTAALDVRAEAQLFDRFLEVTRGMTTVLVSHRLSSVRHADRIVVIDDGRIVEDGSHEELLVHDGAYARMFTLQASRFALAGGPRVDLDDADEQEDIS